MARHSWQAAEGPQSDTAEGSGKVAGWPTAPLLTADPGRTAPRGRPERAIRGARMERRRSDLEGRRAHRDVYRCRARSPATRGASCPTPTSSPARSGRERIGARDGASARPARRLPRRRACTRGGTRGLRCRSAARKSRRGDRCAGRGHRRDLFECRGAAVRQRRAVRATSLNRHAGGGSRGRGRHPGLEPAPARTRRHRAGGSGQGATVVRWLALEQRLADAYA